MRGRDDGWEIALIGNNVTDEIVTNNCSMANLANGSIFGGTITGRTATGPAGIDELTCYADRGREVWLRLTLRPSVFFR